MAEIKNNTKKDVIYIDGDRNVLGRLATFVAKEALEGKNVNILNADKVVLTGKKSYIVSAYKNRIKSIRGRHKGPFWPKRSDMFVRRAIKRMLPYKKARGAEAFKRINTYNGIPKEFGEVKFVDVPNAKLHPDEVKFLTVGELIKEVGGI